MGTRQILILNIVVTGGLYVASFVALGNSAPTVASDGTEIIEWFSENGLRARTYVWMSTFVSLGLAIFGGQISALLPKPNRYIFLSGALGFAITAQVQGWLWAGLAVDPASLSPAVARTTMVIASYWGPMVNASTTAMAIAVVTLGFGQSPMIPRWLTWLSMLFFLEQAIETITVFGRSGFIAPGSTMNVYVGGILGFAWIAGVVRWAVVQLESVGDAPGKEISHE